MDCRPGRLYRVPRRLRGLYDPPAVPDTRRVEPLIFVGIALAAVAVFVYSWYRKKKRREAFRRFALRHRLEYSERDPFGLIGLPFTLFRKGDGRGIENVVWGEWRGLPMRAFDHWYYDEHTDSEGRTSRSYHRHSCVLVELAAAFPHLSIGREGFLSRLADHVGFRDIELESGEFNRTFQVAASERRFAYELIDARMMRWLLDLRIRGVFEVVGGWLLAYVEGRRDPPAFAPVIEMANAFRDRIPRAAWSLYGGVRGGSSPPSGKGPRISSERTPREERERRERGGKEQA